MAYRCGMCKKQQEAGTKGERAVMNIRPRTYEPGVRRDGTRDSGGQGWEIVREIMVCPSCKKNYDQVRAGD